ncbi:MAG: cell filamentation protein Fic, partial [bacterium]
YGKGKLANAGKVSHEKAMEKTEKEYHKYQVKTLSPVERDYLQAIKAVEKKVTKRTPSKKNKK